MKLRKQAGSLNMRMSPKRAQCDTHKGYQHRCEGADQQSTISLSQAQSDEHKVARQKRRENVTQREIAQHVGPSRIERHKQDEKSETFAFARRTRQIWKRNPSSF